MSRWLSAILLALVVPFLSTTQALPNRQTASGTTINGSVVDGGLTPLAGAAIALEQNGRVTLQTTSDQDGKFTFRAVSPGDYRVRATLSGFPFFSRALKVTGTTASIQLPIVMSRPEESNTRVTDFMPNAKAPTALPLPAPMPAAPPPPPGSARTEAVTVSTSRAVAGGRGAGVAGAVYFQESQENWQYAGMTGEKYASIRPNQFQLTIERKLSTFGADVDTASFTNVRRMLSQGQLPPRDAVRVEEMVNYFRFGYAAPRDGKPVAITTEIGDCPWAPSHKLVLIGAKAATPPKRNYEGRNIVLLIDVSGSMSPAERLPMIKTALGMFVDTLTASDTISLVTYAGTSGIALMPTNGDRKRVIQDAIDSLGAGGSTNGAQGLIAAYRLAREAFIPGGINRVILATDGDFNVGITSQADLYRLIARERDSGVFLSVLGVGSGNLKDQTMEMLADKGNGNYSYLDSLQEARRVLISEGDATLNTVAKDVKFQVEFNPEFVAEWKLIGYENRKMAARDFENDRKDGGEMGAGHTVTVMYEVIPTDDATRRSIGDLSAEARSAKADWFTVNTRYKQPESETSELLTHRARPSERAEFLPFASAVAEFGLLLRDNPRDIERWDRLSRRVSSMRAPAGLSEEKGNFEELVALARALVRR